MLSVVIPVYNENERVLSVLHALLVSVHVPFEVIIVYDHPDDTTIPVVQEHAPQYSFMIRLVRNHWRAGVLNAVKTGFAEARYGVIVVVMGDASDDLAVINEMYEMVARRGYAVVGGSRYMAGGRQVGGPWLKGMLSRAAGLSLYYAAGVPTRDATNSFKMYKRSFIDRMRIESVGGFEFSLELVVKAYISGEKIGEVPAVWRDRTGGKSRFRLWRWAPHYLRWYTYAFTGRVKAWRSG